MTQVAVIHSAFGDIPNTVAIVDCGERTGTAALDYAYFRTQNLEGSWSKGATFEHNGSTYTNGDYSPDVTVMAALHERDGVTYGLRSTSMGDQMLLGTTKYEVAAFGFKEVDKAVA
jgi:hypothetical protein